MRIVWCNYKCHLFDLSVACRIKEEHEKALIAAEDDALAREERCREEARESILKLETEIGRLESLGQKMVEDAQKHAEEKVAAFKLQAEEKEALLHAKLKNRDKESFS